MSIFTNRYAAVWYFLVLIVFEVLLLSKKRSYAAEHTLPNAPVNEDLGYDYRVSVIFAILLFLPLLLIAGFREQYSVGDTWLYVGLFLDYPSSVSELSEYLTWEEKDTGFIIFSTIIKQFFGSDYTIWLMIISSISALCLALTYRRYTSEIVMCAFLFFASTDFVSWMMNGMRQFLVASIVFAAFPLLLKKKRLLFIVIVLILYTFHSSALIIIPMYLIALGKPFNKKTVTILALMMGFIVFLDAFTPFLEDALSTTDFKGVVGQFEQDDGTNVLRVLVYSIPAILAIVFRKKIPENTPEIINVSINMSLISMGFYVISIFTSGIYIGRIPIYFSLFSYILLPWEIRTFFDKDMQKMVYSLLIGGYIVFFVLQIIQWGII